ncbi:hypothetical protein MPTA5024_17590 [Microbispora sp. ATCC PTA-5024]|nr:hypothetical protein MPTA5024_17590 [Microbispora sp. ATCC PTA-5024]
MLASAGDDGVLRLSDVRTLATVAAIRVDDSLSDCVWTPDGSRLYAVGSAGVYGFFLRHYRDGGADERPAVIAN